MMEKARKSRCSSPDRRVLGLVQFDQLPSAVLYVTRLPRTESAQAKNINKFAKQHRIRQKHEIVDTLCNDPAVITAVLKKITSDWKPFPYGTAKNLYEGSVRSFRALIRAAMKENPAALLFDLSLAQESIQEKDAAIAGLLEVRDEQMAKLAGFEVQISRLKTMYSTAKNHLSGLEELRAQNRRLEHRVSQLEDALYELDEFVDEDYEDYWLSDDSAESDPLPNICTGSYTVVHSRDAPDGFTSCPDCNRVYDVDELLIVYDEGGELRPPRHPLIQGSIPPHS